MKMEGRSDTNKFSIKYYKVRHFTPKEAKEYFRDMRVVNYVYQHETSMKLSSWHLIKSWQIKEKVGCKLSEK